MFHLYADVSTRTILTEFSGTLDADVSAAQSRLFSLVVSRYKPIASIINCVAVSNCRLPRNIIEERFLSCYPGLTKKILVFHEKKAKKFLCNHMDIAPKPAFSSPIWVSRLNDALALMRSNGGSFFPINDDGELVDWNETYIFKRLEAIDAEMGTLSSARHWRKLLLEAGKKAAHQEIESVTPKGMLICPDSSDHG